jgi:aspartate-semialdehyde dehydrogenase
MPPGLTHASSPHVAIVGASSFRGKELKQVLEDRHFPAGEIVLLDQSVMAGTLTEAAGEPTFIRELAEDSFDGVRFAFFAGTPADAARNWEAAQRAGATVIDLTGGTAASGRATAWIPALGPVLAPRPPAAAKGPVANGPAHPGAYYSPPTPAIVACTLAAALSQFDPARIVVVLFPPVSEREQPGIEELESQTANLLSFRPIAKEIFDEQVAFNLLSAYGGESRPSLESVRQGIVRDVSAYLAGRALVPAIQLVQAPVFYGYAFTAFAEFKSALSNQDVEAAFAELGVKVDAHGEAGPTNIGIAGESEIHLGPMAADPAIAAGQWFWGVADNLRLAATNAVRIAEELVAESRLA